MSRDFQHRTFLGGAKWGLSNHNRHLSFCLFHILEWDTFGPSPRGPFWRGKLSSIQRRSSAKRVSKENHRKSRPFLATTKHVSHLLATTCKKRNLSSCVVFGFAPSPPSVFLGSSRWLTLTAGRPTSSGEFFERKGKREKERWKRKRARGQN